MPAAMLRYNGVRLSCHQSGQFTDGLEGSHCAEARPRARQRYVHIQGRTSLCLSSSLYLPRSLFLSLSLSIYA